MLIKTGYIFRELSLIISPLNKKEKLKNDIRQDFKEAREGILKLNSDVRLGVYLAYIYYLKLLEKIEKTSPEQILKQRYRVSDTAKLSLLVKAWMRYQSGKL